MRDIAPIPFDPRRFRTSAEHYVRGRLTYPDALIERVVAMTRLTRQHAVLDLGCGPGFLAAAFAPRVGEVLGLDPEPAMIEAAQAYCRERGVAVRFELGSSYELEKLAGPYHVVTMGRSFHWMDRPATLKALDRLVERDGAVVLFGDSHVKVPQNAWREEFQAVLEPYARRDSAHVRIRKTEGTWMGHESFLLESSFNRLERHTVFQRLETPVECLVDRALSMSPTSPERLGAELEAMTTSLREVLLRHTTDRMITEVVESEALVAFRG